MGPRTRALLVVNPNNPTGSFVSRDELDRLAAICGPRGIALIVDEVFADYELDAGRSWQTGRESLARDDVLVFGLGGLSKSIGLPQLKLGWIAVAGPDRVVSEAIGRLELICDTYLSVSTPVQLAAAELLERGAAVRGQIAARVVANYGRLKALSASAPSACVLTASAGWYAVVQVPTLRPEEELVLDLVTSDGVLVASRLFLRLSARVLSDREPVAAGGALRRRRRADARPCGTVASFA